MFFWGLAVFVRRFFEISFFKELIFELRLFDLVCFEYVLSAVFVFGCAVLFYRKFFVLCGSDPVSAEGFCVYLLKPEH